MERFEVEVKVYLKEGLLDPAGRAIEEGLKRLGLKSIFNTRAGKLIKFEIEANSEEDIRKFMDRASTFLRNPVIEDLTYTVRKL